MGAHMQKLAADALLERGVGFKIPAPFLYRLFGRKVMTLNVKRLYLGSLLYLSELADLSEWVSLDVGVVRQRTIEELGSQAKSLPIPVISENILRVTRAVAALLLNGKWRIRLFRWWLARVLRRRCTADQLQELVMWLFAYGRAESFTNTTKLLLAMSMTTPTRNLGQRGERS